jgi:hypothetical protein
MGGARVSASYVVETLQIIAGIVRDAVPDGSGWQVHDRVPMQPVPPCIVCRPGGGQPLAVGGTYALDTDLVCIAGRTDQPAALDTVMRMVEAVAAALTASDLARLGGWQPPTWGAPGLTVVGGQPYLACVATITTPVLEEG